MRSDSCAVGLYRIDVKIEIPITWWRSFLTEESQYYHLTHEIAAAVGATTRTLGVPGTPAVSLSAVRDDNLLPNRLIRVFINGRWCPFPADVWSLAWNYAAGSTQDASIGLCDIFEQLGAASATTHTLVDPCEIIVLACKDAIYAQPSALFGDASFTAYLCSLNHLHSELQEHAPCLPLDVLRVALNEVLDLGISIADLEKVRSIMTRPELQSSEKPGELFITALNPRHIDIHIRNDNLKLLTTSWNDNKEHFRSLRSRLFRHTGLNFPNCRFVIDELLNNDSIAVSINHLLALPRMVSGFIDNVGRDALDVIENVLCVNASHFIDTQNIQEALSAAEWFCPLLVNTMRTYYSIEEVTYIFRNLVDEGLPIRPIRALLAGLLDAGVVVANSTSVTFDEVAVVATEPEAIQMLKHQKIVSSLRARMRRHITARYAWPENFIRPLYLSEVTKQYLVEDIKNKNADVKYPTNWTAYQEILDSIHDGIRSLESHTASTCIICDNPTRQRFRELIRSEFPRLPVLTNQDLTPYCQYL